MGLVFVFVLDIDLSFVLFVVLLLVAVFSFSVRFSIVMFVIMCIRHRNGHMRSHVIVFVIRIISRNRIRLFLIIRIRNGMCGCMDFCAGVWI